MYTETIEVSLNKEPKRFKKLQNRFYAGKMVNGSIVVEMSLSCNSPREGIIGTFVIKR